MAFRTGTSGILFAEKNDGSVTIGYEDYGVDFFDGGDYEVTYSLTAENAEKLKKCLNIQENETFKECLIKNFGAEFSGNSFTEFRDKHQIKYELFTWISFD